MKNSSFSKVRPRRNLLATSRESRRVFSLIKCLGLGLGLAAVITPEHAVRADSTWTGATNQDYNNGANWSNGFPNGTNAIINTATGNYPIISATPTSGTPVDIFVGRSGTGRLDQTAGTAGSGNGNWTFLGTDGGGGVGTGTFNLAATSATGGTTTVSAKARAALPLAVCISAAANSTATAPARST